MLLGNKTVANDWTSKYISQVGPTVSSVCAPEVFTIPHGTKQIFSADEQTPRISQYQK